MKTEKRKVFAKETRDLPYLEGTSPGEAQLATKLRNDILETVFDCFIRPDDEKPDLSPASRWQRATQLWKIMITECRAAYFIELNDSNFMEWINRGQPTSLPLSHSEIESRNRNLSELHGSEAVVRQAKAVRATLLRLADEYQESLAHLNVTTRMLQNLIRFRYNLKYKMDAQWFLEKQPKDFFRYERVFAELLIAEDE